MNKTLCALFLLFAVAAANIHELALEDLDDDVMMNADLQVGDFFDCTRSIGKVIPAGQQFIQDVKAKADVHIIIADLKDVLSHLDNICEKCGIPKPVIGGKEIDLQICALDAADLADDVVEVIENVKNFPKVLTSLAKLFQNIPETLAACGIQRA